MEDEVRMIEDDWNDKATDPLAVPTPTPSPIPNQNLNDAVNFTIIKTL